MYYHVLSGSIMYYQVRPCNVFHVILISTPVRLQSSTLTTVTLTSCLLISSDLSHLSSDSCLCRRSGYAWTVRYPCHSPSQTSQYLALHIDLDVSAAVVPAIGGYWSQEARAEFERLSLEKKLVATVCRLDETKTLTNIEPSVLVNLHNTLTNPYIDIERALIDAGHAKFRPDCWLAACGSYAVTPSLTSSSLLTLDMPRVLFLILSQNS